MISSSSINSIPEVVEKIVFDENTIQKRVKELARQISHDYHRKNLVVVGILEGAFMFTRDLVKKLSFPVAPGFIQISRYERRPHTGEVRIIKDLQRDICGKHVLLIEDIVDTGLTLNYLLRILVERKPASLAICTLLERAELRLVEIPITYVGFHVKDQFLIGYGLDYRESYRELPFVATMNLKETDRRTSDH